MRNSSKSGEHPVWQIPIAAGATGTPVGYASTPSLLRSAVAGVAVVLAVFAPWLVHLAPVAGSPLGATFLPLFYAPLLAALVLRLPLAVTVAALAPLASRLLTGMPSGTVLPGLMIGIVFFVVGVRSLRRHHWMYVAPAAYIFSLLASAITTALIPNLTNVDLMNAMETGWPGVVVLAAAGFFAQKTLR